MTQHGSRGWWSVGACFIPCYELEPSSWLCLGGIEMCQKYEHGCAVSGSQQGRDKCETSYANMHGDTEEKGGIFVFINAKEKKENPSREDNNGLDRLGCVVQTKE